MSREEAAETMYGALCEMVAFDSTEDPERARAVTIYMLDAALASGFVVLRSELEHKANLFPDGTVFRHHTREDTRVHGHPSEKLYRIREEGD